MDLLSHQNYRDFLDYVPRIKSSLKEWQLVDINLLDEPSEALLIDDAAQLIFRLFQHYDGKLYICSDHALFMLIHWGDSSDPMLIPQRIEARLPPGSCRVVACQPTPEGLRKLEIRIQLALAQHASYSAARKARKENIILVADDDMYMRTLIKKGVGAHATLHEVSRGSDVVSAYKTCKPDVLLLDIHMPGRDGDDILSDILAIDPDAYIIMFSADSSKENVTSTAQNGAKGFMAKPFSKQKLMEYVQNCPTFSIADSSCQETGRL